LFHAIILSTAVLVSASQISSSSVVVVATNVSGTNVEDRALASGMLDGVKDRFPVQQLPVVHSDVNLCIEDPVCLRDIAHQRGARYLLVNGVAPISETEIVVSMQLLVLDTGQTIADVSEIMTVHGNPYAYGRTFTQKSLAQVDTSKLNFDSLNDGNQNPGVVTQTRVFSPSPVGWAGWGLVLLAGGIAGASLGLGFAGVADQKDFLPLLPAETIVSFSWVPIWATLGSGLTLVGVDTIRNQWPTTPQSRTQPQLFTPNDTAAHTK
jgi:hypothetical protein